MLSPPGIMRPPRPVELGDAPHLAHRDAERRGRPRRARRSRPAGRGRRTARPSPAPRRRAARPRGSARSRGRASPRRGRARPRPRPSASCQWVVARTIGLRARRGVRRLEDARADEHRLGAERHHERGVGRRRDAAGGEVRDRQPARLAPRAARARRARRASLASAIRSSGSSGRQAADAGRDRAHVAHGLDDVAGAGLALGADQRRALADAAQRLAEVAAAAHERAP